MNYTQAQIDRANAVSLEDFLRTQGETLIKSGREYQDIYELSFPTRIYRALKINQIHTVRELLIQTCAGCRIRNLGDISKIQIREKLIVEKLLPVHFEVESLPDSLPQLDIEAEIFRKLCNVQPHY